jgi:hypothetical protein
MNYISLQHFSEANPLLPASVRTEAASSLLKGDGMISLRLVQLIERHSDELVSELVTKLEASSRTSDLHKVPAEELRRRIHEILLHLSEWLLIKTGRDIEQRRPSGISIFLSSTISL